jgi:hypothetical protein
MTVEVFIKLQLMMNSSDKKNDMNFWSEGKQQMQLSQDLPRLIQSAPQLHDFLSSTTLIYMLKSNHAPGYPRTVQRAAVRGSRLPRRDVSGAREAAVWVPRERWR